MDLEKKGKTVINVKHWQGDIIFGDKIVQSSAPRPRASEDENQAISNKTCPSCGILVTPSQKICEKCGAILKRGVDER